MPLRDIIGGKLTRTRLEISPTRYAYGFSTNTEDRFQGFHSGNILVIVDEASGVDEFIYNAIDGVTTASNSKLLLIGNPHGYAGTFYDAFHKNRSQFHTVHISAFDLPAFKAQSITEKQHPRRRISRSRAGRPDRGRPKPARRQSTPRSLNAKVGHQSLQLTRSPIVPSTKPAY